jgi:hypothetical protein
MLRRTGWLGLLAVFSLCLALPGAATDPPAVGADGLAGALASPGLGRLWAPVPPRPDPQGQIARLQLRRNLVNVSKLALAVVGAGLLTWGIWLRKRGRPRAHAALRDALLVGLGFLGFWGWWNFLYLHYPGWLHEHEVFNYYIGSKYFPELGYTRLYECTALADFSGGLQARVEARSITNLESYVLEGTQAVLADPQRCLRHFAPARWSAFQEDVAWFRAQFEPDLWEALQRDHGYNAPPSWGLLGNLLANTAPASRGQLLLLSLLDPVLLLVMWACVGWAFGWRPLCIALLYWGTNHAGEFGWTGGGFLRNDWLVATVVGICLLRRGHSLLAGLLLGHSALLRIFPALTLAAVGAAAGLRALAARSLEPLLVERRFALGALLAAALVLPLSSIVAGGETAWTDFAENTRLHLATPGSNTVGLRTALSYSQAGRLKQLATNPDPSAAWKRAREAAFQDRRVLYALALLAYLALLLRALAGQDAWAAAILGIGALPVLLDPACYYTKVLFVFAFLAPRREAIGVALLGLSAAQWLVAAGFSEWDDIFTWTSVASVAFAVFATAAARIPRASGQAASE